MIGFLVGTARSFDIVQDASGVGWKVACPLPLTPEQSVELFITTVVRDDAILLYGFDTQAQQACFEALRKVSGVGPATALAVLSRLDPPALAAAVASKDTSALSKVKGVGVKAAERIVTMISLPAGIVPASAATLAPADELSAALVSLGWPQSEADRALAAARASLPAGADDAVILRTALRS